MKKWIVIMLAASLAASMAACKKNVQNGNISSEEETPSSQSEAQADPEQEAVLQAADAFLAACTGLDSDELSGYAGQLNLKADLSSLEDGGTKKAAEMMVKHLKMEPAGEARIDGDTAALPITVTNTDYSSVITNLAPQIMQAVLTNPSMTQDEMTALVTPLLTEQLEKAEGNTISKQIDLRLERADGKWTVKADMELADALSGGMLDALKGILPQMGDSASSGAE